MGGKFPPFKQLKNNTMKNNLTTYKTDLENKGEFVEMTICNEEEVWEDEFGNYWSVGLEVIRDFKNATPIKDY